MLELFKEVTASGQIAIAVITYLIVWGIKQTPLDNKYMPLISLGIGLIGGISLGLCLSDTGAVFGAIDGIIAGGFASGGHDLMKSLKSMIIGDDNDGNQ